MCAVTAEAAAFTATWRVGSRTVTLTSPHPKPGQALSAVVEWDPAMPLKLTPAELVQYRAGRDAALADMAQALGITVAVVG
jgi:hypothetical protein